MGEIMDDKLRLHTNLYGFDGIIGRRDYFLNLVIISAISILFTLPYTMWFFANIETIGDSLRLSNMFLSAPLLLKVWTFIGVVIICTIKISNIFRRLNDIFGDIKLSVNIICSIIFALFAISFALPIWALLIFGAINFIVEMILLFRTGKITSNYPYDFKKEFNWGAFLGTWIWGVFNKSYKTLWSWILGFTPWSAHFALYCGLKGNEWAYNNKKCTDVDAFNKSQEKQAVIFAVLSFLIAPIIYFLIIFGITALIMSAVFVDIKSNPESAEQKIEKLSDTLNSFSSMYFENHIITDSENKFYVRSSDWTRYSFSEKKDILDMAASISANERTKHSKTKKLYTKSDELIRTKIYGSDTDKLLGEFIIDEGIVEKGSFKDIMKASLNAYHFYKE